MNCRSPDVLDGWLTEIGQRLQLHSRNQRKNGGAGLPEPDRASLQCAAQADLAVVLRHQPEIVITSVGSPAPVLAPLHEAGALVFADVASIRHAERAIEAGADGLVLLTAGAGGQTGWLNPFVFVRAVRNFFDGPVVLAGGIGDGHALRAAEALGCDLAYMGTKFIATPESMADPRYKAMLVASSADDILLTTAFTGLQTNMLRPSISAAGLDPDDLPPRGAIDIAEDIDVGARESARALARYLERRPFHLRRHRRAAGRRAGRPHPRRIPRRKGPLNPSPHGAPATKRFQGSDPAYRTPSDARSIPKDSPCQPTAPGPRPTAATWRAPAACGAPPA